MTNEPFFRRTGGGYQPQPIARGPWNPNSLHGRVVIGLLGYEAERQFGGPDWLPARLTVDMYRLPGFDAVEVKSRVIREGGRIKVVDTEFISGGVSQARAVIQLLKRTEKPESEIWEPPSWDAPSPHSLPAPEVRPRPDGRPGMMWETRSISGASMFGNGGGQRERNVSPRRAWIRDIRPMIEGEEMTPFSRVAIVSDIASPFAHSGTNGLDYINTDVTLYLHRVPVSEWIGVETLDHQSSDGIATGICRFYDEQGPIGTGSTAALAQKRQARPPGAPEQAERAKAEGSK